MELRLTREVAQADGTLFGRMDTLGLFQCWTMERKDVAIPAGRYPVIITMSQRFGRPLPLIEHVPQRSGIRIHPGNTDADTEGCILVGQERTANALELSRAAMESLQSKIATVIANGGDVWLTVTNPVDPKLRLV